MLVGTGQSAKVGALARSMAGDKETHIGLLRCNWSHTEQRQAHRPRRT
jgi:hypothetical protein